MPSDPAVSASLSLTATPRDPLSSLLEGTYADPKTGEAVEVATKSLVIADTTAGTEADLIAGLGFGRRLAVVSDAQTHPVLAARVEKALAGRYQIESLVLPGSPHADDATAGRLRAAARGVDAFIAVGSGTINDLTKYVSAAEGKPYAVFGTAPSMNGYVSLTASITMHGHKMTLPAQAPAGAFFDLSVLAAAPKRLIRAGLGDSICRTTAEADWLLSHLLLGTPYRDLPFDLLADDEAQLLDQVLDLLDGSLDAMRTLTRTLLLSGFGTAVVGSSAPASQAEHLVSHYIDMMAEPARPPVFHGEQVGVTTLSIARLQHAMLGELPIVQSDTISDQAIGGHFGADLAPSVLEEFALKRVSADRADALNAVLESEWDNIRTQLEQVLLPIRRIETVLAAAGGPLTPADIHLDRPFYESALRHGREIRNRFTVLDLAALSGRLEPLISSI